MLAGKDLGEPKICFLLIMHTVMLSTYHWSNTALFLASARQESPPREAYLEPTPISTMEFFCENGQRLKGLVSN